jgi:hypothetical protein
MAVTIVPTSTPSTLPYTERALNPATGDLAYPASLLFGADAVLQRIRVRFGFWLGEWFLDTSQGVPYRERVFIRGVKPPAIVAMFRRILLDTPGVMAVPSCTLSAVTSLRTATLSFVAKLSDGTVIQAVNEPFRVTA